MQPTVIGAVLAAIAVVLMARPSATNLVCLVLLSSLFGGAAGLNLPALGGSSVPPADFALLFLAAYLILSPAWRLSNIAIAFRNNAFLAIFCIYGAVTAFLLPRIFAGMMGIVPMNVSGAAMAAIYHVIPLGPSSQNITTAVYLLGTLFAALATTLVVRIEKSEIHLVRVLVAMAWVHVFFGALNLGLSIIGHSDWLMVFRNGHYAQVDQSLGGIHRINGIFPEPSAYAGYGFALLAVNVELWLRGVMSRWTGSAALAMLVMLMLTTSSTAYVACGGYALLLAIRFVATPARVPMTKIAVLGALLFFAVTCALGIAVLVPDIDSKLLHVVQDMTVGKASTSSGRQRLLWAKYGLEAFQKTYGLGIGAGSFRSSSLISAIAGSMGIVGLVAFFGQIFVLVRPLDAASHDLQRRDQDRINVAAGWGAAIGLIPAVISAPGPDPAILFGILSGLAAAKFFPEKPMVLAPSISARRISQPF